MNYTNTLKHLQHITYFIWQLNMCLLLIRIENESLFGEANSLNAKKLKLV
jgi:hypothetical protein